MKADKHAFLNMKIKISDLQSDKEALNMIFQWVVQGTISPLQMQELVLMLEVEL